MPFPPLLSPYYERFSRKSFDVKNRVITQTAQSLSFVRVVARPSADLPVQAPSPA